MLFSTEQEWSIRHLCVVTAFVTIYFILLPTIFHSIDGKLERKIRENKTLWTSRSFHKDGNAVMERVAII